MAIVKALYGHTSQDTAYNVADYPYSFHLRCKIRYWIEYKESKGYRFVSQTENPKTGQWNKPKASTYNLLAEDLYLDENGHVQAYALNEYSEHDKVCEYIQNFPETPAKDRIAYLCKRKYQMYAFCLQENKPVYGSEFPEAERERYQKDAAGWLKAYQIAANTSDVPPTPKKKQKPEQE